MVSGINSNIKLLMGLLDFQYNFLPLETMSKRELQFTFPDFNGKELVVEYI